MCRGVSNERSNHGTPKNDLGISIRREPIGDRTRTRDGGMRVIKISNKPMSTVLRIPQVLYGGTPW